MKYLFDCNTIHAEVFFTVDNVECAVYGVHKLEFAGEFATLENIESICLRFKYSLTRLNPFK